MQVQACIKKLPSARDTVDVTSDYDSPARILDSGSGAIVFLLRGRHKKIIKYYPYVYTHTHAVGVGGSGEGVSDSRPLRKVLVACALSGVQGFPKLLRIARTKLPASWLVNLAPELLLNDFPKHGLATVFAAAPGVDLSLLTAKQLPPRTAVRVGFRLLHLLTVAEERLGSVMHLDLHPGNIIVDLNKSVTTNLLGRSFTSPGVTITDFDLASTDFGEADFGEADDMIRRGRRLNDIISMGARLVPLPTIAFLKQMYVKPASRKDLACVLNPFQVETCEINRSLTQVGMVLLAAAQFRHPDVRNWFVIMKALLGYDSTIQVCSDPRDCIAKNIALLDA